MLIVPVLRVRDGVVVTDDHGQTADCVFRDPLKTARLWRVQNARTLHLEFGEADGSLSLPDEAIVRQLATALDIPLQVALPVLDADLAASILALGAYRVVCPEGHRVSDCARAVERTGASHLCVRMNVAETGDEAASAEARAAELVRAGVRRLVVRCVDEAGGPDVPRVRRIAGAAAEAGRCRTTLGGGVAGYPDLLAATTLAPVVDSVLIRRALYRNQFPCQMIWCWHAKEAVDLDRYSTAGLASS